MYNPKSSVATEFIDDDEIQQTLAYAAANKNNRELVDSILEKAKECKGLSHREAAVLLECELPEENERIRNLAMEIKQKFYGNRIVMFAPLYLSNYCINGCTYCPYHRSNTHIRRKKLTQDEIRAEVIALQDMGHKRLAIETGEVEIGIVATDILYGAYTGTASWANGVKYQKPLAMFTCDMPSLCPFTLAGSGITTLHDLDGKRVGLGPKGSSIDSVFGVVFEEMGITPSMIHNDTWSATITALQDGVIDAIVVQSPAPWPSLTELEATQTVSMIQMTDDELATIKKLYPFYSDSVIPAGTYKANADFEIKTLCQWSVMAASADVSEQVVYDLLDATFSNYDDLAVINNALKLAVPENAEKVGVKWHPGAEKWYTEHGITLQTPGEGFAPMA